MKYVFNQRKPIMGFWEKTIIPMPSIWDILIERRVILVIFQEVNVWATSRLAIFGEPRSIAGR